MSETVTIDQAADLAGVSRRTIYTWLRAGKLKFRRNAGGQIQILTASLWTSWRGGEGQPVRLARAKTLPHVNAEPCRKLQKILRKEAV